MLTLWISCTIQGCYLILCAFSHRIAFDSDDEAWMLPIWFEKPVSTTSKVVCAILLSSSRGLLPKYKSRVHLPCIHLLRKNTCVACQVGFGFVFISGSVGAMIWLQLIGILLRVYASTWYDRFQHFFGLTWQCVRVLNGNKLIESLNDGNRDNIDNIKIWLALTFSNTYMYWIIGYIYTCY